MSATTAMTTEIDQRPQSNAAMAAPGRLTTVNVSNQVSKAPENDSSHNAPWSSTASTYYVLLVLS